MAVEAREVLSKVDDNKLIELYIQAKKFEGLSELSLHSYERELKQFLNFLNTELGKGLFDLKPADIRLWLAHKPELKTRSISRKIAVLKSFWKFLVAEDYTDINIMDKIPSPKNEKSLPKFLTLEEIEAIRNVCHKIRDRAIFELFYSTGCRLSEIWALNRDDINWKDRSIVVKGKGNKQRVVPFSERAEKYLKKYLDSRMDDKKELFLSQRGKRLSRRAIQHLFQSWGEKAGIKKKVHPHLNRHTLASQAVLHGVDIQTVSQILGHASISTTQLYAHITNEHVTKEYSKIPT